MNASYSHYQWLGNQYDALIGDGRAGVEAPSCERGVHVRTCRCTPHLTRVSLLSNGSLAAHQVQTQSAQQFARYGKRVCTCAPADAIHPDLCKARIYWAPSHTQNLNAILPAVCEISKRGVHVRTCRCTPPQTCGKHLSNGSLVTHQIWTQSGQPLWSYRGRGCLRHPLPGTCHVPWQAPVGIGTGQIRNLLNGDIEQRRPLVNRSTRSRDISFSKAWWGRVGSGRVGSGRAYSDFSLKPQKTRSALRAPLVIRIPKLRWPMDITDDFRVKYILCFNPASICSAVTPKLFCFKKVSTCACQLH